MKNILVLGSAGQVGGHLVEYIEENHPDRTIDTMDIVDSEWEDLRTYSGMLTGKVAAADVVVFLAFDVGGSTYLQNYQHSIRFLDNNVRIMENVFRAIQAEGKPVIFASSQMAEMNWSPYGVLKRLGEFYTEAVDGINVRFWNVYGVERDPSKWHVITDFIHMAHESGEIHMRTTGAEERQFLYAEDCSKALVTIVDRFDSLDRSQNYHITSGEWTSITEIANLVALLVGDIRVIPGQKKDTVQGIMNEPDPYINNFWLPETSLEDGIQKVIDWYRVEI